MHSNKCTNTSIHASQRRVWMRWKAIYEEIYKFSSHKILKILKWNNNLLGKFLSFSQFDLEFWSSRNCKWQKKRIIRFRKNKSSIEQIFRIYLSGGNVIWNGSTSTTCWRSLLGSTLGIPYEVELKLRKSYNMRHSESQE